MYVTSRVASKTLDLHPNTLRRYADQNKIDYIRTESGQRRYNINSFVGNKKIAVEKKNICYCRVSSRKQAGDLETQVKFLKEKYPNHEIIEDFGSGINFKRHGLKKILEYSNQKLIGEVVVTYKDRLARIAFELIEHIITLNGGKIVVLNQQQISEEKEFMEDMFSIIHVFSSRHYGSRKYKNKKNKDISKDNSDRKKEKS